MKSSIIFDRNQLSHNASLAREKYENDHSQENKDHLLKSLTELQDFALSDKLEEQLQKSQLDKEELTSLQRIGKVARQDIFLVSRFDELAYENYLSVFRFAALAVKETLEDIDRHVGYPFDAYQAATIEGIDRIGALAKTMKEQIDSSSESRPFLTILQEKTEKLYEKLSSFDDKDRPFEFLGFCDKLKDITEDFWKDVADKVQAVREEQTLSHNNALSQ